ncbi:hypothetical protein [Clostridium sp.]|uniref:hypothetical protein n=1 Tax=Clostridium sp. TaxID=1506 RepID=UPI002915B498|nr:hypothetical protein [Clostridium sp.]MDU4588812.1 hypothetical protein [Clostridium sp.]
MFNREFKFYGKHAIYVKKLTGNIAINKQDNTKVFNRNIDVLLFSGIIGIIYGRKASVDRTKDENGQIPDAHILKDTMIGEGESLNFIYEIIMILHDKNSIDIETRIERAFKYYNKEDEFKKKCFEIYNQYVLGGVEVLYEKIINESVDLEDYMNNLYEFLYEFNTKYNLIKGDEELKYFYNN